MQLHQKLNPHIIFSFYNIKVINVTLINENDEVNKKSPITAIAHIILS